MRIFPDLALGFAALKRAHDWLASFGLYCDHLGPLTADPAQRFHFTESFPHADHPHAAARRVKDRVRHSPAKLLRYFVAHGLLAFDAIRLLECADIEPALGVFALGHHPSAIANQTIHQRDLRAERFALDVVRLGHIARHENVGLNAGGGGVSSHSASSVSGRRDRNLTDAKL